jgi:hypothetical protein
MSYSVKPNTPYKDFLFSRAVNKPVPKGTIYKCPKRNKSFRILEDTIAHGCPLVEDLLTGKKFYMTIYMHYDDPDYLESQK